MQPRRSRRVRSSAWLGHFLASLISPQQKYRQSGQWQERDHAEKPDERRQLSTAERPRQPEILEEVSEIQTVTSADKHDCIRRRPRREINGDENDCVSQKCPHALRRAKWPNIPLVNVMHSAKPAGQSCLDAWLKSTRSLFFQSTYTNSFALSRTWQKSVRAASWLSGAPWAEAVADFALGRMSLP